MQYEDLTLSGIDQSVFDPHATTDNLLAYLQSKSKTVKASPTKNLMKQSSKATIVHPADRQGYDPIKPLKKKLAKLVKEDKVLDSQAYQDDLRQRISKRMREQKDSKSVSITEKNLRRRQA